MTYDEFGDLALSLSDVRENVRRYEIDLFRQDRHLARFRARPNVVAIRVPWDVLHRYRDEHPEVFIDFPHYRGSPYLVASLPALSPDLALEVLQEAWDAAFEEMPPIEV